MKILSIAQNNKIVTSNIYRINIANRTGKKINSEDTAINKISKYLITHLCKILTAIMSLFSKTINCSIKQLIYLSDNNLVSSGKDTNIKLNNVASFGRLTDLQIGFNA